MSRTSMGPIEKACTSKHRYPTKEDANREGQKYKLKNYSCVFCNGWHLTSAGKKKYKPFRNLDPIEKFRRYGVIDNE